jgi:hypothetical protein
VHFKSGLNEIWGCQDSDKSDFGLLSYEIMYIHQHYEGSKETCIRQFIRLLSEFHTVMTGNHSLKNVVRNMQCILTNRLKNQPKI